MRVKSTKRKHRAELAVLVLLTCLLLLSANVLGEDVDTLYLRDGSVLRGDVLRDSAGNYVVFTKFGPVTVRVDEVVYLLARESGEHMVQEIYIVTGKQTEVISIIQKEIPAPDEDIQSFNLLLPGTVVAVFDADDQEVPFQSSSLDSVSKVTIQYEDIISKGTRLLITTRQRDFLKTDTQGRLVYKYNFTPETDVKIRVLVKYPSEWAIESIRPEAFKQYPGLIIWKHSLKRQRTFTPAVTLAPPLPE